MRFSCLRANAVVALLVQAVAFGCSDGPAPDWGSADFAVEAEDSGDADLERRRAAVREYFQARLAELDIVTTTQTDSGTVIDWVPSKQPPIDIKPPPMPEMPELQEGESWARGNASRFFWDLFDSTGIGTNDGGGDDETQSFATINSIWASFPAGTADRQRSESGNNGRNIEDYVIYAAAVGLAEEVERDHNCLGGQAN